MIQVLWPDGGVAQGETWRELEEAMRAAEWHAFPNRHAYRVELRARAKAWSGEPCRATGTSRQFLLGLAKCGLFQVFEGVAGG